MIFIKADLSKTDDIKRVFAEIKDKTNRIDVLVNCAAYGGGAGGKAASFRVVFEKAVVELDGGKFMLYTNESAEEIKIEKKEIVGAKDGGGNVSDLGGYYNELAYFVDCAKNNRKIGEATLDDATESLNFVLKEIKKA